MVQSRHYPFCHRKYAIAYPWSATYPSLSNFNAATTVLGIYTTKFLSVEAIRLGAAFLTGVQDMLTSAPTASEREVPRAGFTALYQITDTTPAAIAPWTITTGYVRVSFGAFPSPPFGGAAPTTRQQRRVDENQYALAVTCSSFITASSGGFDQYTAETFCFWNSASFSFGDYTTLAAVPTASTSSDNDHQEYSRSYTAAFEIVPTTRNTPTGLVPIAVGTYVDGLTATLRSELSSATVGATYRIAAIPAGVPSGTTNSTGTNSLEDWVSQLY